MDAAAEIGRNPVSKHQIPPDAGRVGTSEPVSRDQLTRRERGKGKNNFACMTDHAQDWQSYSVDPLSAVCDDYTASIVTANTLLLTGPHASGPKYVYVGHKILIKQPHDCSY